MSVTFAQGFSAAGVEAGISAVEGKKDLALVVNNGPLDAAAGVFTSKYGWAARIRRASPPAYPVAPATATVYLAMSRLFSLTH